MVLYHCPQPSLRGIELKTLLLTVIIRGTPIKVAIIVSTILSMMETGRIAMKNRGPGLKRCMNMRFPSM